MTPEFIKSPDDRPRYRDRTFRLIISFPVAVYMTIYREIEDFFEGIFHLNFWIAVVFSYFVSVLVLWAINRISWWLDGKRKWRVDTVNRIVLQLWWGFIVPSIVTFILVALFFLLIFGIDIRETEYIQKDFPMARMLIFTGNLYYMAWYLWVVPPPGYVHESAIADWVKGTNLDNHRDMMEKELLHARTEDGVVPVPQENIAAIFREGEYLLLRTFDRQTFRILQPVKEVAQLLNPTHFFKISPRFIVNYKICKHYKTLPNRKMKVQLGQPINAEEEISRYHAAEFIAWMER